MSQLRREGISGYENEIRRIFWDNILIGHPLPFELAARRAYERLCLGWYFENPHHSAVVIVDGRVVGYSLVCSNQIAHQIDQRRRILKLAMAILGALITRRMSVASIRFYLLRIKDSSTIVKSRHAIPADVDVHAHVNIDVSHHDGQVALCLRDHIDSVCRGTGRAGWFGEMNAVGGKRIVGIRRVVGDIVATHTNHTLTWLMNERVDRLTTVRRPGSEVAA